MLYDFTNFEYYYMFHDFTIFWHGGYVIYVDCKRKIWNLEIRIYIYSKEIHMYIYAYIIFK